MRIGIDVMGGDFAPRAPIEGAVKAALELGEEAKIVLIGDEHMINSELEVYPDLPKDIFDIVHTDQYIGMSEHPTKALREKPRSSIAVGIGMVKAEQIDGFVSAGNTGAMLVASIFGLGTIKGVSRPTIGLLFPNSKDGISLLCDVGANIDCKAEALKDFGILGSVFMKEVMGVEKPRVALLNVGEEEGKGPQIVQNAYELLKSTSIVNFIGNAEGRDLYHGKADVYVCDGFTGNIVLKFGESLYQTLAARYTVDSYMERFNFENYGGVPILGVKGISVIGHGNSTGKAVENMVYKAASAAKSDLTIKIRTAFEGLQAQG